MHVAITVFTILLSLKFGQWSTWRHYHPSMLFIAVGGLLYEYIVQEYSLWKFHPDFLYSHEMTVIVYALIIMPLSIFLYLSHIPEKWFHRALYILLWTGIYITTEWILYLFGRISYENGWVFGYSILFDIVMFSVMALHHYYPTKAYIVSVFIIIFLIIFFKVPFEFAL